ncbi:MAG: adenosylmethionine decarboxylase [Alphaproteobacteria bacterium]|nr:adenosylmethionine decarboxylase [Alphaproteobacteria bacterium]
MNDRALAQLGMDLDLRSGTAQVQDEIGTAALFDDGSKDFFQERDGIRYAGTHLIVDLMGAVRLDDITHVERALRAAVEVTGATLLHLYLHHFTPNLGVSGVAVLAESHISVHTWPEAGYAALDVFMCGRTDPHKAIAVLEAAFRPRRLVVTEHLRGREA